MSSYHSSDQTRDRSGSHGSHRHASPGSASRSHARSSTDADGSVQMSSPPSFNLSREQKDEIDRTAHEFQLTQEEVMEQYRIMEELQKDHSDQRNGHAATHSANHTTSTSTSTTTTPPQIHANNLPSSGHGVVTYDASTIQRYTKKKGEEKRYVRRGNTGDMDTSGNLVENTPPRSTTIVRLADPPAHYYTPASPTSGGDTRTAVEHDDDDDVSLTMSQVAGTRGLFPPNPKDATCKPPLASRIRKNLTVMPLRDRVRPCERVVPVHPNNSSDDDPRSQIPLQIPSSCLSNPRARGTRRTLLRLPCDSCGQTLVIPKQAILVTCHSCRHVRPASLSSWGY